MPPRPHGIDPRAPRFNQGVTGVATLLAFVLDLPALVPVFAAILGLGAVFGPKANLTGHAFKRVVKPALRLGPPKKLKDPAPPRFAMSLGSVFLALATAGLYAAPTVWGGWLGWGPALTVSALALLAAVTDVCLGCEVYLLLQKWTGGAARAES